MSYNSSIDVHDSDIRHALNVIESTYGNVCSVAEKKKSLLKFGQNETLGSSIETVWTQGGNETYVTTNAIDKFSSSSADDTVEMVIEGHTVSGTGADAQYTFVIQTVTLEGRTEKSLTTPLARVSRAYDNSVTGLAGDFYIYEDDTVSNGVPQTDSKIHLKILGTGGSTQSLKAATTISNVDYYIITSLWCSVEKKTTAVVDFVLEIRQPGGVFRPRTWMTLNTAAQTSQQIDFKPYVIVPKNADVRVRATASTTSVGVNAAFNGYLAKVIE